MSTVVRLRVDRPRAKSMLSLPASYVMVELISEVLMSTTLSRRARPRWLSTDFFGARSATMAPSFSNSVGSASRFGESEGSQITADSSMGRTTSSITSTVGSSPAS